MTKIAIIGYGRFGKTLHRLFGNDFEVSIFHHDADPHEIYHFAQVVFYCVPIEEFEKIIKSHKKYFNNHLLIDVLSVKEHPKRVFAKFLKSTHTRALLTHPMFGPDSSKNGFIGLPIVLDRNTASNEEYGFWKSYFEKKGLITVELSAKEHDLLAANSQGLTHFIGRLLEKLKVKSSAIDTYGTKRLLEVMDQTCNDSWQLFKNLQNYNGFTKRMRLRLGEAYDVLYNALLPRRVNRNYLVFGIQGGKGSFNEEAILDYIKRHEIKKYKIKYLYTSEKVLRAVHEGDVDFGLFAVHNAAGGVVNESMRAMARYKFKIVEEFSILIRHCLMKRKDIDESLIHTIMAHSQVFLQCSETLMKKYPTLIQKVGEGDMQDTAAAAHTLATGKIEKNTYILGPRILSRMYNFDVIAEDLQDLKNNLTGFFLIKR
jgi:prephenate dehydrogenase